MNTILDFPDKNRIEQEAAEWIVIFEGEEPPTRQNIEALKTWMNLSPDHREALIRLATLWNDMGVLAELQIPIEPSSEARPQHYQRFFERLLATTLINPLDRLRNAKSNWLAVTSAVIALGIGVILLPSAAWHPGQGENNIYTTAIGESVSTKLADGSMLWLNTNSQVTVEYSQSRRRITLNRGEAHFKVAREPRRPFEVYAGSRMVRAVGTAFSVYRDSNNIKVKVTVTEGKVDLAIVKLNTAPVVESSDKHQSRSHNSAPEAPLSTSGEGTTLKGITQIVGSLEAGQSAVLSEGQDSLVEPVTNHKQQELARRLSWREGQLVFAGETLKEVVEEVSRYTRMRIEVVDPDIRHMRIGGQFQVGKIEALFDVLESGFGLKISHLSDNHVEIHAPEENAFENFGKKYFSH